MSSQKTKEEPAVEAVDSQTENLNLFFKWDELSRNLASSGQTNPPWFRVVGLDDGELLFFTPHGAKPTTGVSQKKWDAERWEHPDAKIASIVGPTKGMIDTLLKETGANAVSAGVELIEQCLQAMPSGFVLKRPFTIGGVTVLDAGDQYPAPWKLREMKVDGLEADVVVKQYVLKCLPKKFRDMVHTGALCMAVPETDFMVNTGSEKGSDEPAKMIDDPRSKSAGEDENFGVASSGA